jgi:hypothetical protein
MATQISVVEDIRHSAVQTQTSNTSLEDVGMKNVAQRVQVGRSRYSSVMTTVITAVPSCIAALHQHS